MSNAKDFAELMMGRVIYGIPELQLLLLANRNNVFHDNKRILFYSFQRAKANTLNFLVQLCVVLYFLSFDVDQVDGTSGFQSRNQVLDERGFSRTASEKIKKLDVRLAKSERKE